MSKFCTNCGNAVDENAVICVKCGCAIPNTQYNPNMQNTPNMQNCPANKTSVSLILGIVGLVCGLLIAIAGHILCITGIVFGAKEYNQTKRTAGLIVSIVGEVLAIINSILGAILVSGMMF